LRALRANLVSGTDEKRIRTRNKVMDKSKEGLVWLLSEILDRARMCFSSVRNRGSARTGRRPRKGGRFFVRATSQHCGNGEAQFQSPRANAKFRSARP